MTDRSFPSDFLSGVAHAGHQVEGDNDNSDTWFAENVTPTVCQEPSGKACNNWELWSEDIDLAVGMGLNASPTAYLGVLPGLVALRDGS